MSVYMIVEAKVKDLEKYKQYLAQVPQIVAHYGGVYLVRGGKITPSLVGDWNPERLTIIEFPAEANIRAWFSSPEYLAIVPIREAGADIRAVLVEGALPGQK